MGWLVTLLSSLPALLAFISQLWAIIGPLLTHTRAQGFAAAGQAFSATDYNLLVYGQGGGFTALAAFLWLAIRPKMLEMEADHREMCGQRANFARQAQQSVMQRSRAISLATDLGDLSPAARDSVLATARKD